MTSKNACVHGDVWYDSMMGYIAIYVAIMIPGTISYGMYGKSQYLGEAFQWNGWHLGATFCFFLMALVYPALILVHLPEPPDVGEDPNYRHPEDIQTRIYLKEMLLGVLVLGGVFLISFFLA